MFRDKRVALNSGIFSKKIASVLCCMVLLRVLEFVGGALIANCRLVQDMKYKKDMGIVLIQTYVHPTESTIPFSEP